MGFGKVNSCDQCGGVEGREMLVVVVSEGSGWVKILTTGSTLRVGYMVTDMGSLRIYYTVGSGDADFAQKPTH